MCADEIAPALARWLAPYVAAELAKRPAATPGALDEYDAAACAEYVRGLGQGVLNRATDLFTRLKADGRIGSLELASAIGTQTPRNIPANLTNSLKQRARKLGRPVPWTETTDDDQRTVWVDRDGIAARMVEAIQAEHHRRNGPR